MAYPLLKTKKIDRYLLVYYIILFLLTIFLTRPNVTYGGTIRLGYLALMILPFFISKKYSVAAFTAFVSISFNSFYPMLPSIYTPYILIALFLMYPIKNVCKNRLVILFIFIYFFIREYFYANYNVEFLVWSSVALMLSASVNTKEDIKHLAISFVAISLFLSLMFILYGSFFMTVYSVKDDLERVGWINQNLFGGIVGIGIIIAMYIMLNRTRLNIGKPIYIMCIATFVISYIALIMNASRGAIISVSLCSMLLIMTSKVKIKYVIALMALLSAFFIILYMNGYFELLIHRMQDDTFSTGGGRTEIWMEKLFAFDDTTIWEQLFGLGYNGSLSLGNIHLDTHNDFVTSLFAYGYIGLVLLGIFFIMPVIMVSKAERKTVYIFTLYLFIESFVLSPICRGYFTFTMFYVLILRIAYLSKSGITLTGGTSSQEG